MNPWKAIAYALGLICLVLGVYLIATAIRLKQYGEVIDAYAAGELTRQRYVPGVYAKPDIPAIPGTTPILHASGSVHYGPGTSRSVEYAPVPEAPRVGGTEVSPPTSPPPGGLGTPTPPCNLDLLDVTINCAVDAVATPTRPWAKLLVSGSIRDGQKVRLLPSTPAGEVALTVSPAMLTPRLPWELRVGVGTGLTARLGATYMPWRRVGVWADVAAPVTPQGQVEAGAGVSFRF